MHHKKHHRHGGGGDQSQPDSSQQNNTPDPNAQQNQPSQNTPAVQQPQGQSQQPQGGGGGNNGGGNGGGGNDGGGDDGGDDSMNATGNTLPDEHKAVIAEMTELIGDHPHAWLRLEKSYGIDPSSTHEDAVMLALHLAAAHPDFETKFQNQIAQVRNFHWGKGMRIFAAILTGGASLIAEHIAVTVKQHKDAKAAQAAAANKPAPAPDPIANAAANPQQAQPTGATPNKPATESGFFAWIKNLFGGGQSKSATGDSDSHTGVIICIALVLIGGTIAVWYFFIREVEKSNVKKA